MCLARDEQGVSPAQSFRTFLLVLDVKEHCSVSFGGPACICCGLVVYSGKMYCMDFYSLLSAWASFHPSSVFTNASSCFWEILWKRANVSGHAVC